MQCCITNAIHQQGSEQDIILLRIIAHNIQNAIRSTYLWFIYGTIKPPFDFKLYLTARVSC